MSTEQVATTDKIAFVNGSELHKRELFGRKMITSPVEKVTAANVIDVVTKAMSVHKKNAEDIKYLYNYYKGDQPSRYRSRELRDELTQKVVENRANQIVAFKVGFVAGDPICFISARNREEASESAEKLNDVMRVIGKHKKDKQLIKWMYIGGLGYRLVEQNTDPVKKVPFNLYTMDPQTTFMIRSSDHTNRQLAGVYYATDEENNRVYSVFTPTEFFTWKDGETSVTRKKNNFGMIPIIEYPANMERQGCIEIVISLLDAINDFDCDRLEAVAQFVQSLLVLYNCQVDEGVTADSIRKAGMILLKSANGEKADVKNLSEQLDQTQNQSLKEDLYRAVHEIVGMPSQSDGNTSDSSNNGAVILRNGWQGAETRARDFEAEFKEPEMEMTWLLSIISKNISKKNGGFTFDPMDVEPKFTRHNYDNLLSKSQTLTTMLGSDKIHPKYAYEASGMFNDSEEAYRAGMEWYESLQKLNEKLQQAVQQRKQAQQNPEVTEDE